MSMTYYDCYRSQTVEEVMETLDELIFSTDSGFDRNIQDKMEQRFNEMWIEIQKLKEENEILKLDKSHMTCTECGNTAMNRTGILLTDEIKKLQSKIEIYEECRAIIAGERGMFICGEYTGKEKEYSTKSEKAIAVICGEKIKTMA